MSRLEKLVSPEAICERIIAVGSDRYSERRKASVEREEKKLVVFKGGGIFT